VKLKQPKVAVVRFPGSNCDLDTVHALRTLGSSKTNLVWHEDACIRDYDAVILPGGFSFGDYLRAGAIAAKSPAIERISALADHGVPILGICNGFQILIEAGLLPGSLLRNTSLRFVCRWVSVKVVNNSTRFTTRMKMGQVLWLPIAHNEGRYYDSPERVQKLSAQGQTVFKYCDESGNITGKANPTGTLENLAGVCNRKGNIVGLMPHPERASEAVLSPFETSDGALLFESMLEGL